MNRRLCFFIVAFVLAIIFIFDNFVFIPNQDASLNPIYGTSHNKKYAFAVKNDIKNIKNIKNLKHTSTPKNVVNKNSETINNLNSQIDAQSALLIDINQNDVLWQKNISEKRSIASLTKIMTAIIAFEYGQIEETVTISNAVTKARAYRGINLQPGDHVKLEDLLYSLLLYSANDAAIAIAEHIGHGQSNFVDMMNNKAKDIGAKSTHFTNPHGLDHRLHYSTAKDIAMIARYALRFRKFREIVSSKEHLINCGKTSLLITNRNILIGNYPGANGVKTGHTNGAGYCLVASAKRDNINLLSIVLGAKTQKKVFKQSQLLLDYGFSKYEKKLVIKKANTYKRVKTRYGQVINLTAKHDKYAMVRKDLKITIKPIIERSYLEPPMVKDTPVGKLIVKQSNRIITTDDLVTKSNIKKPTFSQVFSYYIRALISKDF